MIWTPKFQSLLWSLSFDLAEISTEANLPLQPLALALQRNCSEADRRFRSRKPHTLDLFTVFLFFVGPEFLFDFQRCKILCSHSGFDQRQHSRTRPTGLGTGRAAAFLRFVPLLRNQRLNNDYFGLSHEISQNYGQAFSFLKVLSAQLQRYSLGSASIRWTVTLRLPLEPAPSDHRGIHSRPLAFVDLANSNNLESSQFLPSLHLSILKFETWQLPIWHRRLP